MKIELDINLDIFEECYNEDGEQLGGTLKDQIEEKILQSVENRIYNAVLGQFEIAISKTIIEKVEAKTEETFTDFLNRQITTTDTWGNVKEAGTVKEIIENRFNKWACQTVDERGRESTDKYGTLYTRTEYLINTLVEKESAAFMKKTVDAVSKTLEEKLSDDFREMIGQKIADKIGLDKLLPKRLK